LVARLAVYPFFPYNCHQVITDKTKEAFLMGKPKKQTSPRKTGLRRSHLSLELKRKVNGLLSKAGKKVKTTTTKRETGKKKA
jgi:hypothetical protein